MIIPGHFFGAVEELEPGTGTFEEGGLVYASVIGEPVHEKHQARVSGGVQSLKRGAAVYAQVKDVYDQIALLEFQPLERRAAHSTYSYLRISEVQKRYTESFRDVLRIGDYVRAEVVEIKPLGIYLTIAAPYLGVVKAFCSVCRGLLVKDEGNEGKCISCSKNESRKWAETEIGGKI